MAKYWIPISEDGSEVKVTSAQFEAALNWASLTESTPNEPRHIIEVFPGRDNWANGQRRCCTALAKCGVLRGDDRQGYIMPGMARRHLERRRRGNDLVPKDQETALEMAGKAANHAAAKGVFADYQSRKSRNTLQRQRAGLALFAEYLGQAGVHVEGEALITEPMAWKGVTWGLVEGYVKWLLREGYAIPTINVRLSTVKTYARLATKAGAVDRQEYAMIKLVQGYARGEQKHVNEKREDAGIPTRVGDKKAEPVRVVNGQADQLKAQPDTPQGRRDAVMMALMLDHGLRVGEVALLTVSDFDLETGELNFYRPKVDMVQTHELTGDALKAARAYIEQDASRDPDDPLLRPSKKSGELNSRPDMKGMTERAITARVNVLGEAVGIEGLSAHDLRHFWATRAARNGTPLERLMDAGGWKSPAMPMRYIERAKIANEGVVLD